MWSDALDGMDGIRSGRTRKAALEMRNELSAFRKRGVRAVLALDTRAATYLAATSA